MRFLSGAHVAACVTLCLVAAPGCERDRDATPAKRPALTYDPVETRRALQDLAGGHVFVLKRGDAAFTEYRDVANTARAIDRSVTLVAPFTFAEIRLRHGAAVVVALLRGLAPERLRELAPRYIIEGALPPSPSSPPSSVALDLVLGVELAKMLGLSTLDTQIEIQLIADPAVGVTSDTPYRPARVVGLLGSGLAEYDYRLVLARFADTQSLLGRGDAAMGLELLLDAETSARRVAGALETKLGAGYQATDWCDLNKAFLGCTWSE